MPAIVLRDLPDRPGIDGRELARAHVPTDAVDAVVTLVERAIGWGHEMSRVEVEPAVHGEYVAPCGCRYDIVEDDDGPDLARTVACEHHPDDTGTVLAAG